MKKFTFVLLVAALWGCSSSNADTKADEAVVEEPAKETETTEQEEVDLAANIIEAHEAFTAGDVEGSMKFFAEDATWVEVGGSKAEGKAAVQEHLFGNLKGMMSDVAVAPSRIFVDEEAGVAIYQGVLKGTNDGPLGPDMPATNKEVGNDYAHVVWFNEDGKITKLHALGNGTTIPKLAGVMPTPEGQPPATVSDWPGEPESFMASDNPEAVEVTDAVMDAALAGDIETYAAGYADGVAINDYGSHGLGMTKDQLKAWMTQMHSSFSEMSAEMHGEWTFGDVVVGYYTVSMKHTGDMGPMKATNKDVSITVLDFVKVENGKIVEIDSYSNPMQLMAQLAPPEQQASN